MFLRLLNSESVDFLSNRVNESVPLKLPRITQSIVFHVSCYNFEININETKQIENVCVFID